MTTYKNYVTREIGAFIWDGFTDPAGVGVNLFNLLDGAALVGVDLTDEQKEGVLNHGNTFGEWTSDDEEVRNAIAAATDMQDYEKMFDWLAFVVGDTTAAALVKEWKEEAARATDPEERDAIEAALAVLDGESPEALAVCYVATDPVDFTVLPGGATTQAERKLCRELALN